MQHAIIYLLTNTIDHNQYIGFTSRTLVKRCEEHLAEANLTRKNSHLYNAIRYYGWAAFTSEILYMSEDAHHCKNEAEVALIADYNTYKGRGYNLTEGGDGCVGYKHSQESKDKISNAKKGTKHSQETIDKMTKSRQGRIFSQETKLKMSAAKTGKKLSIETKLKMSKPKSEKTKIKMKGPKSAEAKSNMSKNRMGMKFSDEHRKNLSLAAKNRKRRKIN